MYPYCMWRCCDWQPNTNSLGVRGSLMKLQGLFSLVSCHFHLAKRKLTWKSFCFEGESIMKENDGTHHALPPWSSTAMPSLLPKIAQTDGRLLMWPSYLNIHFWLRLVWKVDTAVLCTFLLLSEGCGVQVLLCCWFLGVYLNVTALWRLKAWEMMLKNDFAVDRGCQCVALFWVGFCHLVRVGEHPEAFT